MERFVKFRGYDRIADCWCFGVPVKDQDVKGRWWIMFNEKDGAIIDDPKSIGEYTGLKDKKGKKSFEGDLIKYDGSDDLFKILFEKGEFKLLALSKGLSAHKVMVSIKHLEFSEIVGNIHENPELLH